MEAYLWNSSLFLFGGDVEASWTASWEVLLGEAAGGLHVQS